MQNKKHIVIFSHGFGVLRDDCGTFTDIAQAMPEVLSFLFDYNDIDWDKKIMTVVPFSKAVKMLKEKITKTREENPETIIDLVCHSQGTIIAALAKPEGVRKAIFLAPPFDLDITRSVNRYKSKPGTHIDINGVSELDPKYGLRRLVPAEYWQERMKVENIITEYNAFSEITEIIAIRAKQDNVLAETNLDRLSKKIQMLDLDGDHNFSGEARSALVEKVKEILKL